MDSHPDGCQPLAVLYLGHCAPEALISNDSILGHVVYRINSHSANVSHDAARAAGPSSRSPL